MRWVAFSSIFAAIAGYLVILLATQTLGASRFEAFSVFWGLFFAILGTLQGIMHETTRAVRAAQGRAQQNRPEPGRPEGARPLRLAALAGIGAGALTAASGPLWGPRILPEDHLALGVGLLACATALAAAQSALGGLLSGAGRWAAFGRLLSLEALLRLVVAGVAVVSADPITGFMFATVAGLLATPAVLLGPAGRAVRGLRADVPTGPFLRRCGQAMLAAGATSLLVVGFPVLVKGALGGVDPVVISNLLLAVTLTRAPVLTPLTSFQNAIVVYFVDRLAAGRRALWAPLSGLAALSAVGAVLAWSVGPPIIALMGPDFGVGGGVLAALTLAAGATGALFVTGSAVLARERHAVYAAGWWTASLAAVALLLLVPGAVVATVLALAVGPACGALVHLLWGMGPARG
ncbi:MAG: hypothetical protein Q4E05_04435 [Pseudoclavibacter sp.]|nr:hypothetical protein [Pseudoclavibacter sp.]